MKKNFCKKLLPFVFIGIIMTGCTAKSSDNNIESAQIAQAEYTFTDDLGREVSVSSPKSVVTLIGSFTDIWLLSGGTVTGACDDSWASLNLDLPDNVINTGKVKEPNLESILSAEPDFIIGSVKTSSNLDLMETFESLGIPCAYFDVTGFDDYLDMLNICTDITGRKDLYKANGLDVQQLMDIGLTGEGASAPGAGSQRQGRGGIKVVEITDAAKGGGHVDQHPGGLHLGAEGVDLLTLGGVHIQRAAVTRAAFTHQLITDIQGLLKGLGPVHPQHGAELLVGPGVVVA